MLSVATNNRKFAVTSVTISYDFFLAMGVLLPVGLKLSRSTYQYRQPLIEPSTLEVLNLFPTVTHYYSGR